MKFSLTSIITSLLIVAPVVQSQSTGCNKAPPASGVKSINVNGQNRQYTLTLPNNYDRTKAHRVVFGFHWLNSQMGNVAPGYYGLRNLAGDSTIFVAPDGLNSGWANTNGADVAFVDAIIGTLDNTLCIDPKQRFATGFSYGGAMSFALACARPNIFRAVSVIGSGQISGCAGGTTPVAYLGIHGVQDNVLPISMGRSLRDRFLNNNQCQPKTAPEPGSGSGSIVKTTYSCQSGFPVWWIAHGGGHVGDPRNNGQEFAPTETWNFFTTAL